MIFLEKLLFFYSINTKGDKYAGLTFIIVEGFLIYNIPEIQELFDIKMFLNV